MCTEQIQLSFIICILFYLKAAPVQKPKVEEHNGADDDDDIDLFGSDEEDEEAERIKAERAGIRPEESQKTSPHRQILHPAGRQTCTRTSTLTILKCQV